MNFSDPSGLTPAADDINTHPAWQNRDVYCYGNCGSGYNNTGDDLYGVHSETYVSNGDGTATFVGASDKYYEDGASTSSPGFAPLGSGAGSLGDSAGSGGASGGVSPQNDIVVTARRDSILRRIYRTFISDPCAGQGTDEGAGKPAPLMPYNVNEKSSLLRYYGHVLPDHNFDSSAPVLSMILTAIQTQPALGSGQSIVYTVNTGQYVGFDARHGAGTDYITVVMGPEMEGSRTLATAYPGCR